MNKVEKLKKLFGPPALAATVATGMLLHAAVAWADGCTSVSTSNGFNECGSAYSTPCSKPASEGTGACLSAWGNVIVYWCCPTSDGCSGFYEYYGAGGTPYCFGYCCPT
jgi:hypothetical protein